MLMYFEIQRWLPSFLPSRAAVKALDETEEGSFLREIG